MSTDRDTTRIVRSWLRTDEHESADRVVGAVLDRIDTTPQRRATWWPVRRLPEMNNTAKLAMGAAAVVVALLGIGFLLPGGPNIGGPGPSLPTAEPSVAEPTPSPQGLLPEGSHILWDAEMGVPMTVTIPAPDWYGEPRDGILIKNDDSAAPDGGGMIVFAGEGDLFVYGDPCKWSTTRPDTPATTVDELVAALAAQPSRDASAPVDIAVDGYAGKSITLHVPDDAVFGDCDRAEFRTLVEGADGARYHQDPGQIDKLWILDVDGELVVIDTGYYEGTPQVVIDELEAIVESTTFE
jgi:hypothetical protein